MQGQSSGYSGTEYDRYADRLDDSTLGKLKQQFWTAKQTIVSKFGKKEDDHLVASDAELDAKLQVYFSVKQTCESLLRCIERYQDYLCDLSQEENSLGRFLKSRGKSDKTQAGKIMAAVGRAQGYTAQQRLSLRVPLVRLYQELEVFTERAVVDCQRTVMAMEEARMHYRGSLLWMKDVSDQMNPDSYKQLEKFRKVQAQVRRNKAKFDKLKLDCLQKIDLLAASRCNLFSQILANYQICLMTFWDKTAKVHSVIADSFKGYQYYEFTILKDLTEPSKKPVDNAAPAVEGKENAAEEPENELISLAETKRSDSLENLFKDSPETERAAKDFDKMSDDLDALLSLTASKKVKGTNGKSDGTSPMCADGSKSESAALLEFLEEAESNQTEQTFAQQWDQAFGLGSAFSTHQPLASSISNEPKAPAETSTGKNVLPSELLDLQMPNFGIPASNAAFAQMSQAGFGLMNNAAPSLQPLMKPTLNLAGENEPKKIASKSAIDKTAWFNLFADVDPLQNPDALGKASGAGADNGC